METDSTELVGLDVGFGMIIDSILRGRIETVTVGIVQAYDPVRQTADIQPAIKRKLENDGESKTRPVIPDVRIIFPGSGGFWFTFPINVGDPVLLLIPSRSLDNWFGSGGIAEPAGTGIFQISDAVAIPGILPDADVIPEISTTALMLRGRDPLGTSLSISETGIEIVGELRVKGDVVIGDLVPLSLSSHIHDVQSAPGATGGPLPGPPI